MPERLVDVERQGAEVLHTFPVTVSSPADEETFKQKALEGAGHPCRASPKVCGIRRRRLVAIAPRPSSLTQATYASSGSFSSECSSSTICSPCLWPI